MSQCNAKNPNIPNLRTTVGLADFEEIIIRLREYEIGKLALVVTGG